MLTKKCVRIEQFYAHGRFIELVYAVSTWIHRLLVLYQAVSSSFLPNVHCGVVYFHQTVGCVWLLPLAACGNSFTSGEPTYPLDSHPRPGVAQSGNSWGTPEKCATRVRRWRETPAWTKKVRFPSTVLRRVSNWLSVGIRSVFYCGSWLTGHQYETSYPVPAEPEWETHSTKGMTWITRHVSTFKPSCLI